MRNMIKGLAVILGIAFLTACNNGTEEIKAQATEAEFQQITDYLSVGQTYSDEEFEITINSCEGFELSDNPPNEGYRYIKVNMSVKNTLDRERFFSFVEDLTAYSSGEYVECYPLRSETPLYGNISAGELVSDDIIYEVPLESKQLEIRCISVENEAEPSMENTFRFDI